MTRFVLTALGLAFPLVACVGSDKGDDTAIDDSVSEGDSDTDADTDSDTDTDSDSDTDVEVTSFEGSHFILLDYDETPEVSCTTVWADSGSASGSACDSCIWAFDIDSTFDEASSTDGGIVGASCFDYTGSDDFSWTLGYDPDIYGYGFAYLWYYSSYYGAWYPFAYSYWDDSSGYMFWVRGYGYYYQYPYGEYYYTNVFGGNAYVE